ncbi:hypothetical protein D6C91_05591 [Aureobasidium pullulans]|uniref:Rhodopsin domain-containing protein n=1 Tax=Aureobasidium pullulans TaxID=5580 RepID=A0A4V4KJB8_AURPU|nr:hypothetical protein D6C91_05591 [Aureobasidium pullulans]
MVLVKHASDQVDQESRWRTIVAVSMATTVIAFAMVVGRVWPRRWSMKAEEWIISTTLLSYVGKPFYQFGIAGFKLSLCLTFLRLTKNTGLASFRSFTTGIAISSTICHFAFTLIVLFFCIPQSTILWPRSQFCSTYLSSPCCLIYFSATSSSNSAEKATLYISFALGLLTTVFSIIRITYFPVVSTKGDNSDVVMYGTLEFNFGIATSCVPFVRAQLSSARTVRQTPKGYKTHVTGPDPAIELKDVCKSDSDSQKGLVEENARDDIQSNLSSPIHI